MSEKNVRLRWIQTSNGLYLSASDMADVIREIAAHNGDPFDVLGQIRMLERQILPTKEGAVMRSERIIMSGEHWRLVSRNGKEILEAHQPWLRDSEEWKTTNAWSETVVMEIVRELVYTRLELGRLLAKTKDGPPTEASDPL